MLNQFTSIFTADRHHSNWFEWVQLLLLIDVIRHSFKRCAETVLQKTWKHSFLSRQEWWPLAVIPSDIQI